MEIYIYNIRCTTFGWHLYNEDTSLERESKYIRISGMLIVDWSSIVVVWNCRHAYLISIYRTGTT